MADDFEEMTFQARQAANAVYDALGPGFNEDTYRSALVMELTERKIPFQGDKIIERARKQVEIEIEKSMSRLKLSIVDMVVETSEKIIKKSLDSQDQRRLISGFIEDMENYHVKA